MLRSSAILLLCLIAVVGYAQRSFFRNIENELLPEVDVQHYQPIDFAWNLPGKIQAYINSGITELVEERNPAHALTDFEGALQQDPNLFIALYYRGVCYKMIDSLSRAERDFVLAAKADALRAETYIELGEVYHLQQKFADATAMYEHAVKLNPSLGEPYYLLGHLALREYNLPKAKRLYRKAGEVDVNFVKGFIKRAILVDDEKKFDDAIALLDQAIAIDPASMAAYFYRGMFCLHERRYNDGLGSWNKLLAFQPENPQFLLLRAILYMELQDFDKCFVDLKKVLSSNVQDENNFTASQSSADKRLDLQFALNYIIRNAYGLQEDPLKAVKKGFCLFIAGAEEEARSEFKKSARLEPSAVSYFLTAITFDHTREYDSAFYYYDKTLAYDNDNFDAHKKRGIYRSDRKDWKGAIKDFSEMERLEPGLKVTSKLRGQIRIQHKDFYGGIIDFTKYIKSDSTDDQIYFMRGVCFYGVEDYKNALTDFKKVLELDPRREDAAEQIVYSYLSLKDTTSALATLDELAQSLKHDYYLVDLQIRLLIRQKKYDLARELLDKMLDRNVYQFTQTVSSQFQFLSALIDFQTGLYDNAINKLNRAIRLDDTNLEARYYRGKSWIRLNRPAKALDDFKSLSEKKYLDSEQILRELQEANLRR